MWLLQCIICSFFQIELMKQMHPKSLTALKKRDPACHSAIIHPNNYMTIACLFYPRQNIHPYSKSGTAIGNKVSALIPCTHETFTLHTPF